MAFWYNSRMAREMLDLAEAAEHVHLEVNELKHFAQRGEIAAVKHGESWRFSHRELDEWAQRDLLAADKKALALRHQVILDEERRARRETCAIAGLFKASAVDLNIGAKAKAGLLRDMTDLAVKSELVYDADGLYKELVAREEAASTAIGNGFALLHPRFHDPYMFEDSFIAYGRSTHPVFFGAPDGEATRHFFLVCSTDHEAHLHILAHLAMMIHGTTLAERLDEAEDVDSALRAIAECENEFRKTP